MSRLSINKLSITSGAWPIGVAALGIFFAGCVVPPDRKPAELAWPFPSGKPRIEYIRTFCCSDDLKRSGPQAFLNSLIRTVAGRLSMSKPYGITADHEGRVYVTDTGLQAVWVFDEKTRQVSFLGEGRLQTPIGVAVDKAGNIFVSDTGTQRVYIFSRDGKLIRALGQKGELGNPSGLAIDHASNYLYVASVKHHKIRVYDSGDGRFLFDIGEQGSDGGQFNFPTNLSVRHGKLYVTDTGNFRVQLFDINGKFLKVLGRAEGALGIFGLPKGIGVDSTGHIYVADAAFNSLRVLTEERELLVVGSKGIDPGSFRLPAGLYVDEKDRIYVVDQYNRRVQVFQYLSEKHSPIVAKRR
jgi:DNA-binding beta-propeller fold protein YncE